MGSPLVYAGTINVAYIFIGDKLMETREPRKPRILRFPAWEAYAETLLGEFPEATVFLEIVGSRTPHLFGATWSGRVPSNEDLRKLWGELGAQPTP